MSVEDASVARYIVGEELRRLDLPIKAIGETSEVSGSIVFDEDGEVDSEFVHPSGWAVGIQERRGPA